MSAERHFQALPGGNAREMPRSSEAEEYVLAACLVDGRETIGRALQAGVTSKAFFFPANVILWEVMVELFRQRPPVTLEMLAEELGTRRQMDAVGGFPYLLQVTGKVPTTTHVGYFIEKVLEKSALRAAVRIGNETVEAAYAYTGGPIDNVFSAQLSALSSAVRYARRGGGPARLAEQIDAVLAETTAAVEGRLNTEGWIYTGLANFDQRCLPMGSQSEDYLVVDAAGSGLGKSAFMRQVAGATLARGQRARIYSRETSTAGCIEQLAATRATLDLKHRNSWTKDMLTKFTVEIAALRELADKRMWCVENTPATPLLTIEDLEDDARYFAATQGAPHLWVVDYLQLLMAKKRFNSREQEVAYVSHRLQGLCRELGGVWLVGCQMNEQGLAEMRTVRRDGDDKVMHRLPKPGDLRESQAIFHDADRVIAHYLPPVDSREQDQTTPNIEYPEVWLCQIKRRKGATGVVKCRFEKPYTRFAELPSSTFRSATHEEQGKTKAQFKGERKP
jgi:replicative DNA helicase